VKGLSRLSLKQQLLLAMTLSTAAALSVAGILLFVNEVLQARRELEANIVSLAEVVASSAVAPLAFGDVDAAQHTLDGLRLEHQVVRAALLRGERGDRVLASYERPGAIPFPPLARGGEGHASLGGLLTVRRKLGHRGDTVGWLVLEAELGDSAPRIRRYAATLAGVMLASALIAGLLASGLQRSVAGPVERLIRVVRDVAASGHYAVRASASGSDEVGRLALGLNAMLSRIEQQDAQLRSSRDDLERRVEERVVELKREVFERRRAEQALKESEEHYRVLFESSSLPMWVYDVDSLRFLAVNPAAVRSYGYSEEEFLAMTIVELRPVDDQAELLARVGAIRNGEDSNPGTGGSRLWRHLKRDGSVIEVEVASSRLSFRDRPARLVIARDVTEKKALEAQLAQAQKMETVGRLAGGVAHDFNNILGVITGYCELLQRRLPGGGDREKVSEIARAADRAASLTRQLLAFSRRQVLAPRQLDLDASVSDMERMLKRLIGEDIELIVRRGHTRGAVMADPTQLEQVLMNLVVNARDAMPRGGRVVIETADVDLDATSAKQLGDLAPGPYVTLSVRDDGTGMDADTLRQLFEPFFTTKEQGRGTGLGLSTVYGIVKQSGGHVAVESELGRGSTFTVYLPRVERDAAGVDAAPTVYRSTSGRGTVLLAEDEPALRGLIAEMLDASGFSVLVSSDSREALHLAEHHGGEIDLLLSDVVMPGLSGPDLAGRVRELRPRTRVVFISGYSDEALSHHGVLDPGVVLIEKPFTGARLAQCLTEVMAGAS
jgi:PAS domain S-box-containing protein